MDNVRFWSYKSVGHFLNRYQFTFSSSIRSLLSLSKMKKFSTLLCLALIGFAAAENGYNYPQPGPVAPKAPVFANVQAPPLPNQYSGHSNFGHVANQQYAHQQFGHVQAQVNAHGPASAPLSFPEPQYGAPAAPAQFPQVNNYQQHQQQSFAPQRQQIVTKDIYIHSAPEDQEETLLGDDIASNAPIRKNYRIVFIKAPSTNLKLATNALRHAQSSNEEKTVIYVLSKKPDLSEVQAQLQQVQGEQKTSKPEVYFIKYKTQEEAARAQQEIQAQYDALGGSTHVSDEGIAPVTSVGSLSGGHGHGHGAAIPISQYARTAQQAYSQQSFSSGVSSSAGVAAPSAGYLPVKAKK